MSNKKLFFSKFGKSILALSLVIPSLYMLTGAETNSNIVSAQNKENQEIVQESNNDADKNENTEVETQPVVSENNKENNDNVVPKEDTKVTIDKKEEVNKTDKEDTYVKDENNNTSNNVQQPTEEPKQPTEEPKQPSEEVKPPTEEVQPPKEEVQQPTQPETCNVLTQEQARQLLVKFNNLVYLYQGDESTFKDVLLNKGYKGYVFLPDIETDIGYFVDKNTHHIYYFHPSGYMELAQ